MGDPLKLLYAGAAAALALGALSGFAMRPNLFATDDRPRGPQMFADWAGEGSTGPFDSGTTFAAYRTGPVPDYVQGTDWAHGWANAEPAITRVRYDDRPPRRADDDDVSQDDDTTVAERDPGNPSREPAYDDAPADSPDGASDGSGEPTGH